MTRVTRIIPLVACRIADVFARDNPRFSRERFLRFVETGNDSAHNLSQTKRGIRE